MKKTGIEFIAEERHEQIEKHGWSLEHDKDYGKGQLIQAAKFCREQAYNNQNDCKSEYFKWPEGWDKYYEDKIRNKSIIGQLTVAGAFYMAENDRLQSSKWEPMINRIAAKIDRLQRVI